MLSLAKLCSNITVASSCCYSVKTGSQVQGVSDQVGKILIHQVKQARDAAPEQARWLGAMINAECTKVVSYETCRLSNASMVFNPGRVISCQGQ